MRVVLRSGRVEEVMRVPADTKLEYPSWVLHSPSQGTDTLYFKTNGHSPTVDVIPVGRPTARSSVVTFRGYKGMVACDGDAKLVCDVPSASSRPAHGTYMLEVWDPAQPQAPPVPPARDASSNGATWDVFKDSCPLFRAAHAAVGPSGEVWVWDEWDLDNGCSLARVVRVPATLTPPAAMVPPASHAPASWEVVGSGTELSRDFGTLLASGDGADVTIRVAGGHKLRAHSPVLAARWEWWRGRQNCAPGTSTSAEVVLEDVTPQAAQALLQFLYTGRASLVCEAGCDQDQQGQGHAAASPSEPASKRARRDQGRAGAGASSSANDASAAVSEGAAPATLLQQVLHVATAYCVPSLRAACLELAAQRINVHSALPWLVFAHEQREQQPELKQLAMNWAVAHYAGEARCAMAWVHLLSASSSIVCLCAATPCSYDALQLIHVPCNTSCMPVASSFSLPHS